MSQKRRNPFPAEFNTDTNTKGIHLHCCLRWPPVTVSSSEFWRTLAGRKAWWEQWSQEGLWRAPGSYTQRGRGWLWIFPWSNTHGKHGPSQDGPNKVRKYEKSRRVEKNCRLLNTTQISFFFFFLVDQSMSKLEVVYLERCTPAVPHLSLYCTYVNVCHVLQKYWGPEEGCWWTRRRGTDEYMNRGAADRVAVLLPGWGERKQSSQVGRGEKDEFGVRFSHSSSFL